MKTVIKITAVAMLSSIICGTTFADGKYIAGDNYFGCTDREYRDKLVTAAVQKDMEAFKNGLMAGMLKGVCVMFSKGEEVFVTDTAIFSGLVQVRRRGDVSEYWTNIEAVQ